VAIATEGNRERLGSQGRYRARSVSGDDRAGETPCVIEFAIVRKGLHDRSASQDNAQTFYRYSTGLNCRITNKRMNIRIRSWQAAGSTGWHMKAIR